MASTTIYTNYYYYSGANYRLGVEVKQQSQSIKNNTSTISYRIFADNTKGSGWWVYYYTPKVVIDGQTVLNQTGSNSYSGGQTLKSGTITVNHTTSGSKNISISISTNIYSSGSNGYRSGSGTLALDRIPRGIYNISFSSGWSTTEGTKAITYSTYTSGTKVVVWWRYYNNRESAWTGWYNITKTDGSHFPNEHSYPSGASFTLNSQSVRNQMYNNKPTITTGDVQIQLNVYYGSTLVETRNYTKALTLKAESPTLSVSAKYTDGTSTNQGVKLLSSTERTGITNLHKLELVSSWGTTDGSRISKVTVTFEGKTYNLTAASMTLKPTKSGSQTISVTVTTARGKSTTKDTTVTNITGYTEPTLSGYTVYRATNSGGGTADPLGGYGIVKGSINYSSVKVGSVEKNAPFWRVDWGNSLSPRTGSSNSILAPAQTGADQALEFTLTYGDKFSTNTIKGAIPTARIPLTVGEYSIGINTVPPDNNMRDGGIWIGGGTLNAHRGIYITNGSDTWQMRIGTGYSDGASGFMFGKVGGNGIALMDDGKIRVVSMSNGNTIKVVDLTKL